MSDSKPDTRNGNNVVSPAYNGGKDYIILRAVPNMRASAAAASESGMRQVYVAIPELPLLHAFGDKLTYPVTINGRTAYKAPKAQLHKLAAKATDEYGYYFIFDSAKAEKEATKKPTNNMSEGGLTAEGG